MTEQIQTSSGASWRNSRLVRVSLMGFVVLGCFGIAGATLRGRPNIEPPAKIDPFYSRPGFQETLTQLNVNLREQALQEGIDDFSERADNFAIARRISLALVGNGLSLEEARALAQVPKDKQIRWWTSYLLQDQRYADYFAERFSRAFVGTDDGPFLLFRRRKFNQWLAEQLSENTRYDKIVRQVIGAEGLWTDTPPVNFVTSTIVDEDGENRADEIRLAGRTARVFLAQRIDCVQCHDDFLGELNFGTFDDPIDGNQQHFHQLAAFYAGTAVSDGVLQGIKEDYKEYEYTYLNEPESEMVPADVPFYEELLPKDGKPRQRLAQWVTHPDNRAFARATVNRVWALMFSRPLVEPVDSIPLDDSVPAVLDTLATDFSEHNFDLQRLIRLIVESEAFQRDSRAGFKVTADHEATWAVFPVTQLRPEQVAGSVIQACKLFAVDDDSSIITQLQKFGQTQDFLKRFGDRGEDEFDSDAVTITQRLELMNGNLVSDGVKNDLVNNATTRIANLVRDNEKVVDLIYMAVFNREPTATELEVCMQHLAETKGNSRTQAVSDIYWAMLNSTEFSWNH